MEECTRKDENTLDEADLVVILRKAAMVGDVTTLTVFKSKLSVKFGGWNLLHTAAWAGSEEIVQFLLDDGFDPEEKDLAGSKAIHLASRQGHLAVVRTLLASGASVNAPGASNSTPLHLAARRNHLDLVKYLLESGAELDAKDRKGRTSLEWAEILGHHSTANVLRSKLM